MSHAATSLNNKFAKTPTLYESSFYEAPKPTSCFIYDRFSCTFGNTVTHIECRANGFPNTVKINADFQEEQNRHGSGMINISGWINNGQSFQFSRYGNAVHIATSSIDYAGDDQKTFKQPTMSEDGHKIEIYFNNADDPGYQTSEVVVDGSHLPIVCHFTYPSSPACTAHCCRYTCR